MKQDTRARLLEVGGEIVHQKGYNSTGIQEVLTATGVPKGSFYFYFKSKEDFGLQLIDQYTDFICDKIDEYLSDQRVLPIQRLRNSFKWFVAIFEQNDFKGGWPIGNLSLEMGDMNDCFRGKLEKALDKIKIKVTECLNEAQEKKEISPALDVFETSDFIMSSWQGVLLQIKVTRSTIPFNIFDKMIFEVILK